MISPKRKKNSRMNILCVTSSYERFVGTLVHSTAGRGFAVIFFGGFGLHSVAVDDLRPLGFFFLGPSASVAFDFGKAL